ncbi:PREDICTED: E3 ubiquitin-protein ligase TRIM39-like [Pseudopodoces humilis]|uniref:E3 ubiquitin-protein ligase TRIM39-like n=1 Tax=Pseudopodoces humilis TaxID=181119 RepID=UPI0003959C7C|nr:PREDICTED: E3 ubiquitin-protein ligase TRIM39-like [Pseudopodoces humilis]
MAQPGPAGQLRAEASCSLCLGLFQEPVSIHCGHNFCRSCIERCWQSCRDSFACPRCRETAPERSLRPNRELAKIIRIAQRLSLRGLPGAGERLCHRHGEALKLFCEEEQSPLCRVCRESQDHRLHAAVPIEEAAQEHKEKLQAHAQILKDRREKMLGLKAAEEEKSLDLLERVDAERQRVRAQVKELHQLLEEQERLLLGRLAKLDREIVRRQEENISRLSEQISSVGQQIQELEDKCQQPPWELLQDSRDILSRLEKQSALEPVETSPELAEEPTGLPQKNVTLKEMLKKFQVSLTLDPDTAHPRLALSEDGKCVWWEDTRRAVPDHPKRFDSSRCVLGREGLGSGRHYWEVQVGNGAAWAVGVAKESVRRKGRISVKPEVGIWAVGQCGSQCQALTSPTVPISLPEAPDVVGVYLDYEAGRVAFFDSQREILMFTYPPMSFGGEQVLPLLCLGRGCQFTLSP